MVVSIAALGKDSSASTLQDATTTYNYLLAKTGTHQTGSQYCYPTTTNPVDSDCVGDNWLPANSTTDWKDYYDAEYQGFAQVSTTSPAGDLTVGKYYSTDGWYQPWSDYQDFLGANLYEEDVYSGTSIGASTLLSTTANTYATSTNACRSTTPTYPACEVVLTNTSTTTYNQAQHETPISVTHSYTYDDYTSSGGLSSGYHNLTQDAETLSTVSGAYATQSYTYATDNQTVTGPPSWTYYTVDSVATSKLVDANSHTWNCQNTTYDENAPAGAKIPAQGLPTTSTSYGNCATQTSPVTTYQGYDKYGNPVASVDGVASANSSLYTSNGCTLGTSPYIYSSSWGKSRYTACSTYDTTYNTLPVTQSNALGQSTTLGYTSEDVLASVQDANNKTTSDSYSYSGGNTTLQVSQPGETNSYSTRSATASSCTYNTGGNALPCYEIDNNSYLYNSVKSSTFYDALGRAIETRTPGAGSGYDTIVMSVYNDALHTSWQSVPFEVTHGSGWVDPNGAKDYQGVTPGGTTTFYDALGRAIATQDPLYGTGADGLACSATLTGTYTACVNYSLGTVSGDSNGYATATAVDADNHLSVAFSDALGRTIYTQQFSGTYTSGTYSVNQQTTIAYNVLDEPTSVTVTDEAPQSGQSISSVTTTASYDDLGRMTQLVDPDRGTHTYSYDADGRVLSDVSGSRTLGTSYDLLGRVGCLQNQAPTESASGACSSGATPYIVNTYDTSTLGTQGSSDFPVGRLTKSVATTYYPDSSSTSITQLYQHDQRGQLITTQLSFSLPGSWNVTSGLPTSQLAQSYNDANQPTTTTTSSIPTGQGTTTTQVYDSTTGVPIGLSNNGSASADLATLVYNARAQLDTINFQTNSGGALLGEQFGYDANLRTTSATASWQSGSGNSGTAFSQTLSYDAASNLTSLSTTQAAVPGQSNSGGSETQVFCYDEQNRLVWAGNAGTPSCSGNGTPSVSGHIGAYTSSYVYTHLGQLWQGPLNGGSTQQQYLYCSSSQPHQLTGLYATGATCSNKTGQVYATSYDAWGNVTSRTYSGTTATLSYDALDHLTQWYASSTNQEQYAYDAAGQRVLRRFTNGGGTTILTYPFGSEEHQYSSTGSNQWNIYYYFLAGRLLGSLDGNGTQFYLVDALGSLLAAFNTSQGGASLKSNQLFGPYGTGRYYACCLNTAKGFLGQYNDGTGLDYLNARYYDPVAGVFLSADQVQGNLQGMNPYAYVQGNPETHSDPTGRYMGTSVPLPQKGGAVGYAIPGTDILTTVINTGYVGSVTSLSGQVTTSASGLVVNTFTRKQQDTYGHYNPLTDAQNSTGAKLSRTIGLDQLQQTWGDPNATWLDKLSAIGRFLGTNANNIMQLAMILGGPEDDGIIAAEEEASGISIKLEGSENIASDPTFPSDPSQLEHIFRESPGHFPEDTPEARQAILDTINDQGIVGADNYGKVWYTRDLPNGQQIWVAVRKGIIQNAGINSESRVWDEILQRLVKP